MKISGLDVKNIGALNALKVDFVKPVVLIAGSNAVGKSTLLDCIRIALTGDAERVSSKKEFGQLLSDGQGSGMTTCYVGSSRTAYAMELPKGASMLMADDMSMPYLLDMTLFTSAKDDEKRALLAHITNTTPTADVLCKRMLDRGCNAEFVKRIESLLLSSIGAAHAHAKEMATEAKGAWKALTSETWGIQKGANFLFKSPNVPVSIASDEKKAREELGRLDQELAYNQQQFAMATITIQQAVAHNATVDAYTRKGGTPQAMDRIKKKLDADQAEFDRVTKAIEDGRGKPIACPCCNENLIYAHDQLVHDSNFKPLAPDTLSKLLASLPMLRSTIDNDYRDIASITAAQLIVKELGGLKDIELLKSNEQAIKDRITGIKADREKAHQLVEKLNNDMRLMKEAIDKNKQAKAYHDEIVNWTQIADALSPSGIPAEMLGRSLKEINLRLAQSSEDAAWPLVKIDDDMAITYGGRAFGLLSESEKWRTNAMITEAISCISQNKFFALDRMDVLDPASRGNCLAWLETLADNSEVDTVIVAATLKQKPSDNDLMQVIWLEKQPLAVQQAA